MRQPARGPLLDGRELRPVHPHCPQLAPLLAGLEDMNDRRQEVPVWDGAQPSLPVRVDIEIWVPALAGYPRRPAVARGMREVRVQRDRTTPLPENERDLPHEKVVRVTADPRRSYDADAGRDELLHHLGDRQRGHAPPPIRSVEHVQVHVSRPDSVEHRGVLLAALAQTLARTRAPAEPVVVRGASSVTRRPCADRDHETAVAGQQLPAREHGIVEMRRQDDRAAHEATDAYESVAAITGAPVVRG